MTETRELVTRGAKLVPDLDISSRRYMASVSVGG